MNNLSQVQNGEDITLMPEFDGDNVNSTEDLYLYYTKPQWALHIEFILMVIVFIVGVPGNALIVTVQYKTKNRTSTDFLVMVMAIYEFFGSLLNTVMKMASDLNVAWKFVSSTFACKFTPFAYFLVQYASGETLCILAIDRCVKTMFPFSRWFTERLAKLVSICIFVFTLAFSSPQCVLALWDPVTLKCALDLSNIVVIQSFGRAGSFMMLTIFCILSISYLLIAMSLRRRHLKKLKQRREQLQTFAGDLQACQPEDGIVKYNATPGAAHITPYLNENYTGQDRQHTAKDCIALQNQPNPGETLANETPNVHLPSVNSNTKMLTLEGRNVNKLTGLMFFISLFYVASYLVLWYLYITSPAALGPGMLQLAYSIPMLNCISNPIMFFSMSSRFRSNVKTLISSKK